MDNVRSSSEKVSRHMSGATSQMARTLMEMLVAKDIAMVMVAGGVGTLFLGEYLGLLNWLNSAVAALLTSLTIFTLLAVVFFCFRPRPRGTNG